MGSFPSCRHGGFICRISILLGVVLWPRRQGSHFYGWEYLFFFRDPIPSPVPIYSFSYSSLFICLLFGAGWGVTAPMFMSITGDLYKGKNFGLIYGMVEGSIGLGSALGAWVAGYIFDQTQNYLWAFILAILLNFISILLVWSAAPRKFRRPRLLPFWSSLC